jgi:acyl-CoA synthetase (AMP-forming)/AMP-acid ligase II
MGEHALLFTNGRVLSIRYIGEICRYLLATPPSPADKAHKVQFAIGNGLRADIWKQFYNRFGQPTILEFYGSTEGNASGMTVYAGQEEGFGSVSHSGPLLRRLVKQVRLLKFDVDTEEPLRDPKTGFCMDADADEPGEVVGLINETEENKKMQAATFKGYLGDKKANDKKILTDVFVKGDKYFRMGDLMKMDKNGWVVSE